MFVRYLGGGIGHLEQFPPANDDDRVTYKYKEDDKGGDGVGGADKDEGDQGDEDDENGEDEDEEGEGGEYSDPVKSSDEDMGNMY